MRQWIPIVVVLLMAVPVRADSAGELVEQADAALKKGDPAAALKLADQAIAADPKLGVAYDKRGTAQFKLGKIKESLADFDRFIELVPKEGPKHWRRGLTLYYADDFAKGVAQFTTSDKEEPNDVENFMKIYDLFRGTAKPEDVFAAAEAGNVKDDLRKKQRFYANYYVGMYYECVGEPKKSLEYLKTAVEKYPIGDYMMDVAKVHIQLRSAKQ